MTRLLIPILILTSLSSCYDARKAMDKAQRKDPKAVAQFCEQTYPCRIDKVDTVVNTEYDFIEVICDSTDTILSHDTIILPVNGPSRSYFIKKSQFVAVPSQVRTITKMVRDSAAISFLQLSLSDCDKQKTELAFKYEQKKTWLMWLLVILLCSLFLNVLLLTQRR